MKINFTCTHWGCEKYPAAVFFNKVIDAAYDGIEINIPLANKEFTDHFLSELKNVINTNPGFTFIAQHILPVVNESVDEYIQKMETDLMNLVALQPHFINSHTGRDYYSFDDNCKIIEAALNISNKTGVRILHETHRGRFSFHASTLLPYLKIFPELELVGDFSHFCTVSESMLQDQEETLQQIIPHVSHIHARVGSEQAPQVNDPWAPEWENHLTRFMGWWAEIIACKQAQGFKEISITPEFGPAPYMPLQPFTKEPLSNQWNNNIFMMNKLKQTFQ